MARSALEKYLWLAKKIYDRSPSGITREKITEDCLDKFGYELSDRTFRNWIDNVRTLLNIEIECDKKGGYKYYVKNKDEIKDGKFNDWVFNTLSNYYLILNNKNLKKYILVEDIPSGHTYLEKIIDAIKNKYKIKITYQKFDQYEPYEVIFCPYCIKLDRKRWYVIGEAEKYNGYGDYEVEKCMRNYALDRIKEIETQNEIFDYPEDFDPDIYFKGCVGVYVDPKIKPEFIKIKLTAKQSNYLRTLPIHESQKEYETSTYYSKFSFEVKPTIEFIQELLKYGPDLEVLEPDFFRESMKKMIQDMLSNYK